MKEEEKDRTAKQVGNLTELKCITRFYEMGYSISIPYGDSDKYDFILDIDDSLYKIQCKHAAIHVNEDNEVDYISIDATWRSGYTRHKKAKRNTYLNNEIDYFCTHYNGKNYLIPVDDCNTSKILRIIPSKNNQTKGVNFLIDYVDEKICKRL